MLRRCYAVRSREEFEAATGQAAPVGKNYFQHTALADIVGAYPMRSGLSEEAAARERAQREAFVDFLLGVLDLNPATRWTPRQAMQHPFITGVWCGVRACTSACSAMRAPHVRGGDLQAKRAGQ